MKKIIVSLTVWLLFFSGDNYLPSGKRVNTSHPLAQGLVGCWYFDEEGGLITIEKVQGFYRCDLINGAVVKPSTKGNAILFDGSNDYIAIGEQLPIVSVTRDMSVVALVKPTDFSTTYNGIISKTSNTGNTNLPAPYDVHIEQTTGKLRYCRGDGGSVAGTNYQCYVSTGALTANVWSQVAYTQNGGNNGTLTFYINSVSAGSTTFTMTNQPSETIDGLPETAVIGNRIPTVNGTPMKGMIKYVLLYKRALSQTEIQALYQNAEQIFINN